MDRIKTGLQGLDEMLRGGIPKGRTILVSGSCGTGKTSLASQFVAQGFSNKEPSVYVTFEQTREKLMEDAAQYGFDFKGMQKTKKFRLIGGSIGKISRFKFRTRASINDLLSEIKEVVEEIKAKRVVIDSINLFAMLFESESDRRNAVAALVSMLEEMKCTTLLTCEIPEHEKSKISWFGFEDFVVDGVIVLKRYKNYGKYERALSIIKMRGVDHSHVISAFTIGKKGLTVYPDQEPNALRFN